ncbi:MAG: MaoC family dehydratase [Chloroflexi bacterium]|nr:MaoC family dehydratase [Chloroflexota bacterium]
MGRYFEEIEVGMRLQHAYQKTITEGEHHLFCAMTLNPQPLHISEAFAKDTQFGQRLVNGLYTLSLVVGITVNDLTFGTIVANLGYESVVHPHPVFHNDTIRVETEVLSKRDSRSKPDRGIVRLKHLGYNQHDDIVCEVIRAVMFLKKPE